MANIQFVDLNGLRTFRTKQNEYNLAHFASLSGGKVTAEQLPSFVDDVVEGYITKNAETGAITFYSDAEKTQVVEGERGKIYHDLAATITAFTDFRAQIMFLSATAFQPQIKPLMTPTATRLSQPTPQKTNSAPRQLLLQQKIRSALFKLAAISTLTQALSALQLQPRQRSALFKSAITST